MALNAGFIGLGIMGRPMAKNLLQAGCKLLVYDVDDAAVAAVVAEGGVSSTLADIGRQCDVVFTILPNGTIVQEVLFAPNGVAGALASGAVVVDMSSVTPSEARYTGEQLAKQGVDFMDAPVSGGEPGAINGTLAFMCGGTQKTFDRVMPYFEIMGASALLVGGMGSGSATKLANQVIVNLTIATVSEALVLATKAGADPAKVYKAIRGGLAGSAVLDAKAPMMYTRNFKPGGKLSINHKDIKNVLSTAHSLDVPMPLSSQLFEIMQALKVDGHMEEDHAGIVQYFEQLAHTKVFSEEE